MLVGTAQQPPSALPTVDITFVVVLLVGFGWLSREIARLRRGQQIAEEELQRITSALGLPPRSQPMIRCPKCATFYAPDLTGCPSCGRAKPSGAVPELVRAAAIDPVTLTAPSSEKTSASSLSNER
jgi:hypothetical protein